MSVHPSSFEIRPGTPQVVLAPMEGVTDYPMRALMGELGAIDSCVTEFIRVSRTVLPGRIFRRQLPELTAGSRTASGTPVVVQLLGGHPERVALSALNAVKAGARAIDLNFGCPAPTVNRNDGGATLLLYPERLEGIVRAVRNALPPEVSVSAKLRLGFSDPETIYENARRAEAGGAKWITIHARTKTDGYKPPAHWDYIGRVRREVGVPVVANGEIWTLDDFRRCRDATGCEHYMLGRGLLADPWLGFAVARELGIPRAEPAYASWPELFERFVAISEPWTKGDPYTVRRLKQWLNFRVRRFPFEGFATLIRLSASAEFLARPEMLPPAPLWGAPPASVVAAASAPTAASAAVSIAALAV